MMQSPHGKSLAHNSYFSVSCASFIQAIMSEDDEGEVGTVPCLSDFDQNIELLTEKRTQVREEALEAMCHCLRAQYLPQAVDDRRWQTVCTFACRLLKSSSSRESVAAARLIGLSALTMGENQPFFDSVSGPLEAAALGTEDDPSAASAVHALGASCFFASGDATDTRRTMDTLFECFESTRDERPIVAAAAISEWSALLTTAPDRADDAFDIAIRSLTDALNGLDVDVRIQSGRTVALLFEMLHNRNGAGEWNIEEYNSRCDTERLVAIVRSLSGTNGSKHDRARQQPEFKIIARSLQEGHFPDETITIHFQQRRFVGWTELLQLERVRAALTTGFHRHLEANEVLHAVWDLEIDRTVVRQKLSQIEKRLTRSPCSAKAKEQTRKLQHRRDVRSESRGEHDGDDEY